MTFLLLLGLLLAALAAALFLAIRHGRRRWAAETQAFRASLDAVSQISLPPVYLEETELPGLPASVQRYFRAVLRDGQPILHSADILTAGDFLIDANKDAWVTFEASQHITAHPAGFDWSARMHMGRGLDVYVRDAYAHGEGRLRAALIGLIPLVNLHGTPDLAEGELMRYLAESVWLPTRLLPSQGVRWEAIDDASARATLTDGITAVSLEFRFDPEGLVTSVWTPARPRLEGKNIVRTPWFGRWTQYGLYHGMRIPVAGEVCWQLPNSNLTYWRGRLLDARYR